MSELSPAAQAAVWRAALARTVSLCANAHACRVPHFIAIGTRLWADQSQYTPLIGRTLAGELMKAAEREVDVRVELTERMLCDLAGRHAHLPSELVLVDCTKAAAQLLRDGCRDIDTDISRTSRFMLGIDAGLVPRLVSLGIDRVANRLLADLAERRQRAVHGTWTEDSPAELR